MSGRSYYSAIVGAFFEESDDSILGKLTTQSAHHVEISPTQRLDGRRARHGNPLAFALASCSY